MHTQIIARDGTALHWCRWSEPTAARGSVLIVHGLGEHIGRYAHVAPRLSAAGWRAFGYDQRGHGLSTGARGRLAQNDDLLVDLATIVDAVRAQADGPLILLGHSMGGLVAARFVAEGLVANPSAWYRRVDALVLTSPAFDPGMNAAQKLLLALLGPLAPGLAVGNGLNPAFVSRDPSVVKAYIADPLVHDRVTPRLVRFIVDEGRAVLRAAAQWRLPTLLMYAGSDRLVAPAGSVAFAAAAPRDVVHTQAFPTLYHEILNEPEQGEVLDALMDWLAQR
jgi:alpha-beta hydrolase superfamily lysophospholipase